MLSWLHRDLTAQKVADTYILMCQLVRFERVDWVMHSHVWLTLDSLNGRKSKMALPQRKQIILRKVSGLTWHSCRMFLETYRCGSHIRSISFYPLSTLFGERCPCRCRTSTTLPHVTPYCSSSRCHLPAMLPP